MLQEPCQPDTALPATAHLTLFGGWPGQTPVNLGPVSERASRPGRNSSGWPARNRHQCVARRRIRQTAAKTTNSAFTQVWILHTLNRLRAPLPEIYNRDGEQFVFTETRFPVDKDRRQEIIQRLDAAAQRRRGDGQALLWTCWQKARPGPAGSWLQVVAKSSRYVQSTFAPETASVR